MYTIKDHYTDTIQYCPQNKKVATTLWMIYLCLKYHKPLSQDISRCKSTSLAPNQTTNHSLLVLSHLVTFGRLNKCHAILWWNMTAVLYEGSFLVHVLDQYFLLFGTVQLCFNTIHFLKLTTTNTYMDKKCVFTMSLMYNLCSTLIMAMIYLTFVMHHCYDVIIGLSCIMYFVHLCGDWFESLCLSQLK